MLSNTSRWIGLSPCHLVMAPKMPETRSTTRAERRPIAMPIWWGWRRFGPGTGAVSVSDSVAVSVALMAIWKLARSGDAAGLRPLASISSAVRPAVDRP